MAVGSRTFWLPRRGNNPDEYEDAFALDDASGRYALADGASEGCFTGLWARLLVEDFVSRAERGRQPMAVLAARRPGAMGHGRWRPEAGLGRRLLGRTGCVCRLPGTSCSRRRRRRSPGFLPMASRGRRRHLPVSHPRQCLCCARFRWTAPTSSATGRSLSARVCPPPPLASDSTSGATAVGSRATGSGP